jgi:hypothetical protein
MTTERRHEVSDIYDAAVQRVDALLRTGDSVDASFIGRTIGPYTVQRLIGAGGMGEVYLAHDTSLARDVALKILPPASSLDPERLARFRREAQILASLNHPGIGQIYGIEESGGVRALVLELVEGPTLADRIARGPLPAQEARTIARQIAAALKAAHDRAIVHRDLTPANVKVRADGTVKVLDFGLAKALADASAQSMVTGPGAVLGTISYMAPEQAMGQKADARADVWAFGVVLYQMLTGRSPFSGGSVAETFGAVLHREPDWTGVPVELRPLLKRCLEKESSRRLSDLGEVVAWLDREAAPPRGPLGWRMWVPTMATTALLLSTALSVGQLEGPPAATSLVQFDLPAPARTTFGGYFALSPDGRRLAFWAADEGGRRAIWVHSLATGDARALEGTGNIGTSSVIWSADSRYVGFVSSDNILKKIRVDGGVAETISRLPGAWGGGSWNANDVIVFGQHNGGLMRVSANGGVPVPLTRLDPARGDIGHGGPRFLPDGLHFIYGRVSRDQRNHGVFVGSVARQPEEQPVTPLIATRSRPVYGPSDRPGRGHLFLVNDEDGELLAYPFNHERLTLAGAPVRIATRTGGVSSSGAFIGSVSASANGVLAHRPATTALDTPIRVVLNWPALLRIR